MRTLRLLRPKQRTTRSQFPAVQPPLPQTIDTDPQRPVATRSLSVAGNWLHAGRTLSIVRMRFPRPVAEMSRRDPSTRAGWTDSALGRYAHRKHRAHDIIFAVQSVFPKATSSRRSRRATRRVARPRLNYALQGGIGAETLYPPGSPVIGFLTLQARSLGLAKGLA